LVHTNIDFEEVRKSAKGNWHVTQTKLKVNSFNQFRSCFAA